MACATGITDPLEGSIKGLSVNEDSSEAVPEPFAKNAAGLGGQDASVDPSQDVEDDEDEVDVYMVDEESLAELEKSMTEEQKASKREESLQLKADGNSKFKAGQYLEAMDAYTRALRTCPLSSAKERSVLYSNRGATRARLDQKEKAIQDCTRAIELNPTYMKPVLKRAQLYKDTEKLDEALADFQRVLELDPDVLEARQACVVLPEQIADRNEKLKTEMLGKLKELGNLVLKPFGMSTDNFKLVKNEESGGYSVQFQK